MQVIFEVFLEPNHLLQNTLLRDNLMVLQAPCPYSQPSVTTVTEV